MKGGVAHGESDPWSWRAGEGRVYCYDLHATILHLMGIDQHEASACGTMAPIKAASLDVHGHVIDEGGIGVKVMICSLAV